MCVEGVYDPLADGVFVALDAVQVDLVQDTAAGTGPGGGLGGFPAGVQPQGQRGVRRSQGRRAIAVAASCGPSAAWRAVDQARP